MHALTTSKTHCGKTDCSLYSLNPSTLMYLHICTKRVARITKGGPLCVVQSIVLKSIISINRCSYCYCWHAVQYMPHTHKHINMQHLHYWPCFPCSSLRLNMTLPQTVLQIAGPAVTYQGVSFDEHITGRIPPLQPTSPFISYYNGWENISGGKIMGLLR